MQNKNTDGTLRLHQCRKVVCPLCVYITSYLSTHLQRVHKLKKGSKGYKDALKNKRNYMGKKKELQRMEKSAKNVDPKKRSSKNTPPQDEELTIRKRPLEILIDKAEMSE